MSELETTSPSQTSQLNTGRQPLLPNGKGPHYQTSGAAVRFSVAIAHRPRIRLNSLAPGPI
jgi:hypothetical protein